MFKINIKIKINHIFANLKQFWNKIAHSEVGNFQTFISLIGQFKTNLIRQSFRNESQQTLNVDSTLIYV